MRTAKRLLKGSVFRNVELAIVLGVNLVVAPYIVRSLGDRMYGFWTLIGALLGYYGLLDFGLSNAATRYISQSLGRGDSENLDRVASTAFMLFCAMGLAAFALTLVVVAATPSFVHDPADALMVRKILLLLGTATAISFPLRVYWGILNSYIRFDILAYVSIARAVLSNVAICLVLSHRCGIMAVAVISFIATLLQSGAQYGYCRAVYSHIKVSPLKYDSSKMGALFDHSWKTFVCSISDVIRIRMDPFVIAAFLKVSLVTPYTIGSGFVTAFNYFLTSSLGMMQPVFSRYEGRGDFDSIRRVLLLVTKLCSLLTIFLGLTILFYANAFIRRWMGPGYDGSAWVAIILTTGCFVSLPQQAGVQLLYGLSEHRSYAAMTAAEAVLNFFLSVVFLKFFGMYGVALGTTVEVVIIKLVVQPVFVCRAVDLPIRAFLLDAVGLTLLKGAVVLGAFYFAIRGLITPDYGRLCACVAAQTVLFIPTAFFSLSASERSFVREVGSSVLRGATVRESEGVGAVS